MTGNDSTAPALSQGSIAAVLGPEVAASLYGSGGAILPTGASGSGDTRPVFMGRNPAKQVLDTSLGGQFRPGGALDPDTTAGSYFKPNGGKPMATVRTEKTWSTTR